MRHIAAYLLLRLGGNDAPDADAVTNVLTAVGVDADADAVAKVVADLSGKVRKLPTRPPPLLAHTHTALHSTPC